ncbi:MAG: gene transfer agent family protein [Rhodobacteraceae bacterium]|nr:gene transfer agent family protein [Paracoccaceae bacterium]
MANPWTGEVALVIDGQRRILKLTLGALAELEQELESGSLVELVERFEGSGFSTSDVLALLGAGLRGGGAEIGTAELARAEIEGGPMQAARVAAELLARTFMLPGET